MSFMPAGMMMPMGGLVTIFQQPAMFQIRRNFFAMGGQMDVLYNGAPYYRCVSVMNPLGFGFNFQITDLMGNPLVYIQHDLIMGLPHYTLFIRGIPFGRIKQDFTMNKQFELLNLLTGEYIIISGDWFGGNFSFLRNGVMNVAQVMMNAGMGETYTVTVSPGEETLFILAAVLTIEKLCHEYQPGSFMGGFSVGGVMGAPMMGGMGGMVEVVAPMGAMGGVVEVIAPMGGVVPMGGGVYF